MAELQIPPSINDTRSQALMDLVERLGEIDLDPASRLSDRFRSRRRVALSRLAV